MKFSSKVKINVKKLNSEVISRLVRAFVHARAHIDKITYFFRETLNIWIFFTWNLNEIMFKSLLEHVNVKSRLFSKHCA